MFRFFCRLIGQVVFLCTWLVGMAAWPAAMQADDWPPVEIDGATAQIEAALGDPTTLEFIETPLADVVDYLKDLHGIEIQIDHRCLEDVGIGSDTPVTRNLKGITLRSALTLVLRELELTYVVRDEVLLITTPEELDGESYAEVYNVAPLLDDEHNAQTLIHVLSQAIGGDGQGPDNRLSMFRGLLILKGSHRDHRQIRALLGTMGAALEIAPPKRKIARAHPVPMDIAVRAAAAPEARAAEPLVRPADPFAAPADPFGGGAADPFAGGDDPFGGDAVPAGGDPFGGGDPGDDPFGGDAAADDPFAEPMPAVDVGDPFDPFAD